MEMPPGPGLPPPELRSILFSNPFPFLQECAERYGHVFSLDIGSMGANTPAISGLWHFVWGEEANSLLATLKEPEVSKGEINRAAFQAQIQPMSICLLDGAEHQRLTQELAPTVNDNDLNLGIYLRHFNRALLEKKPAFEKEKTIRAYDFFREIFLGAAFDSCFGANNSLTGEPNGQNLSENIQRLRKLLLAVHSTIAKNDNLRSGTEALSLIDQEISDRNNAAKKSHQNAEIHSHLDQLITLQQLGARLSNVDIRDNIFATWAVLSRLMFSNSFWGILRATEHKDASKAFIEAGHKFHSAYAGREASTVELRNNKTLNAFIFELLRINPTRYIGANRLTNRHIDFGDFKIPTGSIIGCSDYLTHMDANVYVDPTVFDPTRFLDALPKMHSWVPFGLGQRQCPYSNAIIPGLSYTISALLYHFRFSGENVSFAPEFANQIFIPSSNNQLTVQAI